ncbi:hypothetical protein BDB00DRAFT_214570 [Zychaea mexicana]|uniref:uncharacterized protein n=1 Tax=Zychaea mexicana TaxID=64656 RepID=UPI0022FF1405|nr:uncharacterized protein BDB00DRAFT_214570 [Zychaea mexicana]KAI9473376.1 hypothetical protein BDB00DRAFT_214570 [Zychaea mexicana]
MPPNHQQPTFPKGEPMLWNESSICSYRKYYASKPSLYCAFCCCVLYPKEKYLCTNEDIQLQDYPCVKWDIPPIVTDEFKVAICKSHTKGDDDLVAYMPELLSPVLECTKNLNWRELACISPIRMLSEITRLGSRNGSIMGHYNLAGGLSLDYNYDFAGMRFDSTLGVMYSEENTTSINVATVQRAWNETKAQKPILSEFDDPVLNHELVRYFVKNHTKKMQTIGWDENMIMPVNDIRPTSTDYVDRFEKLSVNASGHSRIKFTDDRLFMLLFPWLFPDRTGQPKYSERERISLKDH